jgi:hypothetical protein
VFFAMKEEIFSCPYCTTCLGKVYTKGEIIINFMTTKKRISCASCLMPFAKDPGTREHEDFCSYCYQGGKHNAENITLADFQTMSYKNMVRDGIPKWKAKFFTWTIRFAPYWKNK